MGKFSHRVAEINKRHKKCHSPIKQNDHLKTVKFINKTCNWKLSWQCAFIYIHAHATLHSNRDSFWNGSGLKITKPSRQEINHSRMKQAIIHSGIAEEYVNWIQCLSCDIWVHEKCARGTFSDRCKACHSKLTYSALEKRSSKPDQYLERS